MRVDPDKFLTELIKLHERNKSKGSVFITMKRTNDKPRKGKKDYSSFEYKCLVRASDGKKKISTMLTAKELPKFQDSYATIQKAHMDSLKKRERVKKSDKSTQQKQ